MKKTIKKSIFRLCRFCSRCITPRYSVSPPVREVEPAVYVVHHQNLRGPIIIMTWFNVFVRTWVLSVFCDHKSCFSHYYNYTFTKRFGIPKLIAAVIVFPLSFCVPALMSLIQAIPVFRNSKSIVKTFKQSIAALTHGQSLLICPDIDYADTSSNMGEMYSGFLQLEKYYMKQTGKHLAFIPLHISKCKHCIYVGEPIYFNNEEHFKQEKEKAYNRLKQEFSRLEEQDI